MVKLGLGPFLPPASMPHRAALNVNIRLMLDLPIIASPISARIPDHEAQLSVPH